MRRAGYTGRLAAFWWSTIAFVLALGGATALVGPASAHARYHYEAPINVLESLSSTADTSTTPTVTARRSAHAARSGATTSARDVRPLFESSLATKAGRGLFDVRGVNPAHPPSQSVVRAMGDQRFCRSSYDCGEIAEDLLSAAGGRGRVLKFDQPSMRAGLRTPEAGGKDIRSYVYHQVYTDGRYAYDPRFSSSPVPLGDYKRMMRGLNPGLRMPR